MAGDTLTAEDDNENMFFLLESEVGGRGQGTNHSTHTVGGGKKVVADGQLQGQDYVRKRLPNVHESDDMAPRRRYAITRNHRGQPLLAVSVSDTQRQGGVNATVTRCWE